MNRIYIRKNHCESVCIDREWMIINSEKCTITKVNSCGARCWALLADRQSVGSLVQALNQRGSATYSEKIKSDVAAFLDQMVQCELLEAVD